MSSQSHRSGLSEQDRTLSDLLETYRHLQSDPSIPDERKQRAAERMKSVWAKLAKLQDPDGFVNHISEVIQREYQRRHHPDEHEGLTGRTKPLCRCDLPRHICEPKQGEVPSKIQSQDLEYIQKADSRTLTREYVQSHRGDVVVREAMESYRDLRADIYGEMSSILAMMMGKDELNSEGGEDAHAAASPSAGEDTMETPRDGHADTDGRTADTDGGEEPDMDELFRGALASALESHGTETAAREATEGAMDLMEVMNAYQNGDVDVQDLMDVANGELTVSELDVETDANPGGGDSE